MADISRRSQEVPDTSGIRALVEKEFKYAPIMVSIAQAESHMRPEAKNPASTASGLFQILKGTWVAYGCLGDPFNAQDNIACARKIYDAEGTIPWISSQDSW